MMPSRTIEGFKLSRQQRRLWLLQRDNIISHRAQCAILIDGNLNTEVLKTALENIVHRHEILRTTFHLPPGVKTPFQVIANNSKPTWNNIDLRDLDSRAQETALEKLFQDEGGRRFDFEKGPLLHLSLMSLSEHKHVLLVSLPSLCADSWTLNNFVYEIGRSYAALLGDGEVSSEAMQYVRFSEWQNELLEAEDEDAKSGRAYWHQQDVATFPALMLPFEGKPSKQALFEPDSLALVIDPHVLSEIEAIVSKYEVSASSFLLACWQILLWRLTGQPDFIIGAGFDGRTFEELHGVLGLFAKSLPVRSHFEENSQFSEILSHVSKATRDAREWHEYFTSEASIGSVEDGVDHDFAPMGFEFEEWLSKHDAAGVSFSIYKQRVDLDRFQLKLRCVRTSDSLITDFHYGPNLFLVDDIKRLAGQFHTLLESVINNPQAAISELKILTNVERQQLLVEFNATQTDYREDKCIHQLFEEQAEHAPGNVAVVFEDQQLTHAELNSRANQLAHHLQRAGVGPDVLVALCVERSLEMVIGLLGILKAGGAYVLLDPVLPKERLAFMLEDTQAPVLLTQRRLLEGLPEHRAQIVCLDADWNVIAQQSNENVMSGATSKNLAYVLFTSGSTGRPKGVAVEHRQLVNYLDGILQRLDLPGGASFATVSTFAADLGNTAVFPALCTGGCLHVVSQERALDPDALAEYFARHPIDCLKIVPSHMEALLAGTHPEKILPRKRLVLGGEALSWDLIEKLQVLAPNCSILNHYGPTEATVGALTYQVKKGQTNNRSATVPIGRPIANTQIYLLDSRRQPVPIWVPAELYIGGAGLARGYLNRPELAAEKFIPNPFSDDPKARLYKTGDLARYLPDGNIEFLGRVDHQVKIRGFRIEPGEVETVLGQHPSVQQVIILAREDEPGEKQLVAYVVPHREPALTASDLRSFLKSKLPEYMVPSAFVMLDALPLTPNGKVDRQALPAPDESRPELEEAFVEPRTPVEALLAGVWAEVLKLEKVSIHDNFFDLGGHSLLAVRLFAQIEKTFGKKLPLVTIFQAPTVEQLAGILRQEGLSTPWSSLVALQPNGPKPPFFWIHGENSSALLPRYLGPDQPLYGLVHQSQDGRRAAYTSVENIAAHYLEEMRSVQPQGPYFLGGFCIGGTLAFEMARQLQRQDQKVALLVLLDATSPGWFRVSPDSPKPLRNTTPFREEVYRHVRNLTLLGAQEKLNYVLKQVKRGVQGMVERVSEIAKRGAYKVCLSIGYPLPPTLLYLYRAEVYHKAAQKYVSQPYPGRVIVFKTEGRSRDPRLVWGRLAGGGLEVIEVPGKHADIVFKETQIEGLAKQLKECLDQAQAKATAAHSEQSVECNADG